MEAPLFPPELARDPVALAAALARGPPPSTGTLNYWVEHACEDTETMLSQGVSPVPQREPDSKTVTQSSPGMQEPQVGSSVVQPVEATELAAMRSENEALREKLEAVCVFPSMPAVMKLNKIGTFSMASMGQVCRHATPRARARSMCPAFSSHAPHAFLTLP